MRVSRNEIRIASFGDLLFSTPIVPQDPPPRKECGAFFIILHICEGRAMRSDPGADMATVPAFRVKEKSTASGAKFQKSLDKAPQMRYNNDVGGALTVASLILVKR